ncbi:MAG: NUDIX domain-containing protein [Bacteroidales bacterium]|jgi:isopentenyldiphosphate isomerase/intracellular septation protein A|nr:NUDIX domain-containing protein [Bacteroidales bacterium]MDD2323165.1 NUDIX domain-containing protein [Bacteroidales bacterium]MDY0286167.1 NUDIX domain-containing protein [Bacteroidales bacterium]HPE87651.1 NUDIX domain-containing protein [Bacteroidales bacterium]
MNRTDLIKKLLPGFLPLFVFIAADAIWGTRIGLLVALAFGGVELIYTGIKERRIDRFIIIDTALLMLLGGVSLVLDNDIFFKLKPAIIEGILCTILAVSAFSKKNIMMHMGQRYMKGIHFNEEQQQIMQKQIRNMFWIFTGHTLLVLFSAFYLSKEAWAFISGGLFYLLFLAYFGFEWMKMRQQKRRMGKEEWLPVVDEEGKILGQAPRSKFHDGSHLLHPVVHLHIISSDRKKIFLQLRSKTKKIQPGRWDTAVGGHVEAGENLETALRRETKEEIGIALSNPQMVLQYKWKSEIESELVFSFFILKDELEITPNEEISDGKYFDVERIEAKLKSGLFTPNFELEFERMKKKGIFNITEDEVHTHSHQ